MCKKFHCIGVTGKYRDESISTTLCALVGFLEKKSLSVLIDENVTLPSDVYDIKQVVSPKALIKQCDLLVVVGGDGSMLRAARLAALNNIPILGINRGSLGFLTDIILKEMTSSLSAILQGDYLEEKRFLLEACLENQQERLCLALNEMVISAEKTAQLIEFETYVNGQFMCSQRSDGMIIATPTGSTAYTLSGGGPIIHPSVEAIVALPMFPHTLSIRPIVLDVNSIIKIIVTDRYLNHPTIYADSQTSNKIYYNKAIYIRKMPQPLTLIHPSNYNYFKALRSKLHWGKKILEK